MICKPQRSCGYVADLGFYYCREAGKKQMSIKGSLYQAFSWCRQEKNASERWNSQQVKHVRESACKHLFKYLNPPTILPTSWKTVSCVTCIWGTYSKCLLHSAGRSQMIGVRVEENCHNWPIIGLIRSWYTWMRYWKQCLQAPLDHFSPASTRFCTIFLYLFSPLSWSLKKAK